MRGRGRKMKMKRRGRLHGASGRHWLLPCRAEGGPRHPDQHWRDPEVPDPHLGGLRSPRPTDWRDPGVQEGCWVMAIKLFLERNSENTWFHLKTGGWGDHTWTLHPSLGACDPHVGPGPTVEGSLPSCPKIGASYFS
uniref:Uncharacterized protein n=1 Tax=Columba livia TaxID=8932 RepID=R7VVS6_COLLI